MPRADREEIQQALAEAADQLEEDLREVFGFEQVQVHRETDPEPSLVVTGPEGRFELAWPPADGLTEAEGRLGAHARIALELLLASRRPGDFFEDYRPVSEDYRHVVFKALKAYVEDSIGDNPYYTPLTFEQRGPVVLVYGDDEYALIADDGSHQGNGILHWKVKRLAAFALTDADAELLDAD
jgi:hypothetical protein